MFFWAWTAYLELVVQAAANGHTTINVKRDQTSGVLGIPPSEYWDGDDGSWSSFGLYIGTPPQEVRLLPSTIHNSVWTVLENGCTSGDDDYMCNLFRGSEYYPDDSTTFDRIGSQYWTLDYGAASVLGYNASAEVGYDNITFGRPGEGLATLSDQVIQGFAADFPYVGVLGLVPQPVSLNGINNDSMSLITSLLADKIIGSTSWAYTAGAAYKKPPIFGSLTFGGYDTTRFVPNDMWIPFDNNVTFDMYVAIQSISSDVTSVPLLTGGIFALIDSLVSTIWLPVDACMLFETTFNLTWFEEDNMYFIDSAAHDALLSLNPTITFTLGPTLSSTATVNITLPYSSFDLQARPSIVPSETFYFPLQRAINSTQYTLGRTFLQEAYIIADYDRSNFSISQALFPSISDPPNLVAIYAPGSEPEETERSGMRTGTIAGISIGSFAGLAIVSCLVFTTCRRRVRKRRITQSSPSPGMDDSSIPMLDGRQLLEKDASEPLAELLSPRGIGARHEVDGSSSRPTEMSGNSSIYELPAVERSSTRGSATLVDLYQPSEARGDRQ